MDIKSKFIVYNKACVRHFKNKKVPLCFSKRSTFKKKFQLTVDLYSYCFTKIHSHYISGIFPGLKRKIQIILAANYILLFIYYTHTHTHTYVYMYFQIFVFTSFCSFCSSRSFSYVVHDETYFSLGYKQRF